MHVQDAESNLRASKHSQMSLSGALIGLRGSPSYGGLLKDSLATAKLLTSSLSNLGKAIKLVDKGKEGTASVETSSLNITPFILDVAYSRRRYSNFI